MVVMIFMIKYEYHDVFHVHDVQQQENLVDINQKERRTTIGVEYHCRQKLLIESCGSWKSIIINT